MSDYYEYLDKKTAPNPVDKRAMPKVVKSLQPQEPHVPMAVEESTASETIIERVKAFWRKQ